MSSLSTTRATATAGERARGADCAVLTLADAAVVLSVGFRYEVRHSGRQELVPRCSLRQERAMLSRPLASIVSQNDDLLTAMRDIKAGEELCYDYAMTEAEKDWCGPAPRIELFLCSVLFHSFCLH